MDYDYIKYLRDSHPTVRLLRLDNAPLIISFLFLQFKKNNNIILSSTEVTTRLSDYLYNLRERYGEEVYPDTAKNYLDRWADYGFLRKYYPSSSDDPLFELTPAAEKAMDWIMDMDRKEFIGTESRLLKIIGILNEIVHKSSDDPQKRLEELEKQKHEIEKEIEKIKAGIIEKLNETQIKERFFDVYDTARKLLSDFRQVEYNFRELDHKVRERQLDSTVKKGKLLDDVFESHDYIWNSDQGKSFRAFWEFLMSPQRQDELNELIELVTALPVIQEIKHDDFVERLKVNLIEAGDKVNKTIHHLVEHLRRFLDDRAILENKRITEIINEIKSLAIEAKENPPKDKGFMLLENRPSVELIMERPLWSPSNNLEIESVLMEEGSADDIDTDALYRQIYMDPAELKERIQEALKSQTQITLKQLAEIYPIVKGTSELITYLSIASKDSKSFVNDDKKEIINVSNKETERHFQIQMPQVIFSR